MSHFFLKNREYNDEETGFSSPRLGDAREAVSSPKKNEISAMEAFKSGT